MILEITSLWKCWLSSFLHCSLYITAYIHDRFSDPFSLYGIQQHGEELITSYDSLATHKSKMYNLYKSFTHYNNDSHKNINSLTATLGSKLNLSFSNRIGQSLPQRAKNCVKTRNLIFIFLAMSGNVHSNPGLKGLIAAVNIPSRALVGLPRTKPHPCLTGYQTFHKVQDNH